MHFIAFITAVSLAFYSVSAFTCQGDLNPYCCETATNYPRGYAGTNCANATVVKAKKCGKGAATDTSNTAPDYECTNSVQQRFICCQQLQVLGTNPEAVAYYCGEPQSK